MSVKVLPPEQVQQQATTVVDPRDVGLLVKVPPPEQAQPQAPAVVDARDVALSTDSAVEPVRREGNGMVLFGTV